MVLTVPNGIEMRVQILNAAVGISLHTNSLEKGTSRLLHPHPRND